jgi:hypothetical protein
MSTEYKSLLLKWLILSATFFVNLMVIVSWVDAGIYKLPTTISGWIPLLTTTMLGVVLLRFSIIQWGDEYSK